MTSGAGLSFGINTVPMATSWPEILAVWQEADEIPEIEHAWLWEHLLPLNRPGSVDIHDGWTMLAALAACTERLRLGIMVTSNALRTPPVLAKVATTVDVISNGRLVMGLGVGGTRQPAGVANPAVVEYAAYGVPLLGPAEGIARLDESCTILRRLWTETEPFDFEGRGYRLSGARCEPKPVQRPGPPLLLGGWGDKTLRVVARHADIWNVPGPPHTPVDVIVARSRVLDEQCDAIGRDPGEVARSTQIIVDYDDPAAARVTLCELIDAGITHLVVNLTPPFPAGAARWAADEIIRPVLAITDGS